MGPAGIPLNSIVIAAPAALEDVADGTPALIRLRRGRKNIIRWIYNRGGEVEVRSALPGQPTNVFHRDEVALIGVVRFVISAPALGV